MSNLFQDLRIASRQLRQRPAFSLLAVLTLALGIGANSAIWSVVQGVLLSPLHYSRPEQLVTIWENRSSRGGPEREWTGKATFLDWKAGSGSFQSMALYTAWLPTLTGLSEPERLTGEAVSTEYFTVLGARPALGRTFMPEEGKKGAAVAAVISDALWRSHFNADRSIVGRAVQLNGEPATVIGVLAPDFKSPFIQGAEIWRPLQLEAAPRDRSAAYLRVVARLRDGVDLAAARADMGRVAHAVAERYPDTYRDVGVTLVPLREALVGVARAGLFVLLGAVGLVLLIACANVANLLLARATTRAREIAVRTALGAGRGRLVRQLLTESVLLSLAGGLLGMGLGGLGTSALRSLAPPNTPRLEEVVVDLRVLAFTVALALATGILFGLAPALQATRPDLGRALKDGSEGAGAARGSGRLRGFLVAAEVALALALTTGAGILIRNFSGLLHLDPGIRPRGVLAANVLLPPARYQQGPDQASFFSQLLERLEATPGVTAAGVVSDAPFSGNDSDSNFVLEGEPLPAKGHEPAAWLRQVSPGYFQTLGLTVVAGRPLGRDDRGTSPPVALVNRTFEHRFFHGRSALGRRFHLGGVDAMEPWTTIVGVVGDVRHRGLGVGPEVEVYLPQSQAPSRAMTVLLRADRDPLQLVPALRSHVLALDPNVPISGVVTMERLISDSLVVNRFLRLLLSGFAILALLLSAVGIYGVTAYNVNQRRREIGLRVALGAGRRQVLQHILGGGMRPTLWGLLAGFACAFAMARAMASLLTTVSSTDPLTFTTAALLLGAVSFLANYLSAQRAAAIDPVQALRGE